ncbi:hypothetical protein [Changpingibacter yushuensis]|uniref:hypothetical protein n=1 Tax=Changpingibacter yushuensis TaxID=2758440 RepID=UPI0015F5F6A8|nr:hypothetical protein [Changpingibacter yushuensis]
MLDGTQALLAFPRGVFRSVGQPQLIGTTAGEPVRRDSMLVLKGTQVVMNGGPDFFCSGPSSSHNRTTTGYPRKSSTQ